MINIDHATDFEPPPAVKDPLGIAIVGQTRGQPRGDPEPRLDLTQDNNAAVRGHPTAIETGGQVLAAKR